MKKEVNKKPKKIPRAYSQKELKEVHDLLKAGDKTALERWSDYFDVLCRISAAKAVASVKGRPWYEERHTELTGAGWTAAREIGQQLIDDPEFVLIKIENYVWKAIKNAINEEDKKDRLFAETHQSTDYQQVKGTGALPDQISKLRKGCFDGFEDRVIRLLEKHPEESVAKMVQRTTAVVRQIRHMVEERKLRLKRTVFAVSQPVSIEPESLESLLTIEREMEEIEAGCTESDREVLRLLANNSEVKVAEILGVDKQEIIWAKGRIAKQYAKRKREEGNPMPWLEKLAKTWQGYRPRKQSNDWLPDDPTRSMSKGKPRVKSNRQQVK